MKTYFASPERSSNEELQKQILFASHNPIITCILESTGSLLAVLNENRQILAINQEILKLLKIEDPEKVFGLRPGEALVCVHAEDEKGGCGTTKYCSTCGAAIAIVSSLETDKTCERLCAITVKKHDGEEDFNFRVRSHPLTIDDKKFLLLFLQDITSHQRVASLEKIFRHDIMNIASGITITSQLMKNSKISENSQYSESLVRLSKRLISEIKIQSILINEEYEEYHLELQEIDTRKIIEELQYLFSAHTVTKGKAFIIKDISYHEKIYTDLTLLLRILINMLINAFEATNKGGEVRFWIEEDDENIIFCTWNRSVIPEDISRRIFQRYYSTKEGNGRGVGTFSMKLLGERYLKGKVNFISLEPEGTTFRLYLPLSI